MINGKQKGSAGERGLASWLRESGCPSARRTQQYSGTEGTSDVVADELSEWHIEHKATKSAKIEPSKLIKWFEQVRTDCPAGKLSVIINTPNARERVAILPFVTVEHLRNHLSNFTQLQLTYVDTLSRIAYDFEYLIRKMMNEWACRTAMQDVFSAPWMGLMGSVLTKYGAEYYMVFSADVWLHFAKTYRQEHPIGALSTSLVQPQDAAQKSLEHQS